MTEGEEGVQASRELMLPSRELNGIWENLIFDEGIKEKLLRYVNMGIFRNIPHLTQKTLNPPEHGYLNSYYVIKTFQLCSSLIRVSILI